MASRVLELKFLADTGSLERGMGKLKGHVHAAVGAFLGFEAVKKAGEFLVDATKAAMDDQKHMAILANQVQASGVSWKEHGAEIQETLEKMAMASGFMKTDLADSFAKLIAATHNSGKATKLLADAQNVARARGIPLATASALLTKVYNGNSGALKRMGLSVVTITTAQDKLRKKHEELIASGHKMTVAENEQYRADMAAAKAKDKHASAVANLDKIHKQYAGASKAYGETTAGAVARMGVAWEEFKVAIGNAILPLLGRLAKFLMDNLPAALAFVKAKIKEFTDGVKEFWARWGADIIAIAKHMMAFLKTEISQELKIIRAVWKVIADLLRGDWSKAWEDIKKLPGVILRALATILRSLATNVILPAARVIGSKLWDGITSLVSGIAGWITGKIHEAGAALRRLVTGIGKDAAKVGSAIWDKLTSAVSSLPGYLAGLVKGALNAAISALNSGLRAVASHWPDIPGAPGPPGFLTSGVPLLAKGGIVRRPTLAVVGEAGPEAIIPLRGGAAVGSGIQIVFNQTPPDANPRAIAAAIDWRLRSVPV